MKKTFIVIVLLVLGLLLRIHNYSKYPQRGATSDEYAFAFSGMSFITKGIPTGWSAIPLYSDRENLTIDGLYFPIVRPYMDHPPLFGLIVGAWTLMSGETGFELVKLSTIRLVPIVLSVGTSVLVYSLAASLYGWHVGVISLAIYAAATIIVVNNRIVVAESLLTLIWMGALVVIQRMKKPAARGYAVAIGILCATAVLTKVLGIVVWASVVAVLTQKRWFKDLVWATLGALVGALAWYWYATRYDAALFWVIQTYQGMTRVLGPKSIWTLLGSPSIVNTIYYDGWYYWGLFSIGVLSLNIKKHFPIVMAAFAYLVLLILSVNETDIHGWYLVPLFPSLAIAGSKLLVESIERSLWTLFIWTAFVGAYLISALYATPFGLTPSVYRWLMGVLLLMTLLSLRFKRVGYGMALLSIIGTAIATGQYVHPA